MLEQFSDDLARDNVQLVIARDLGAVRDVLGRAGEPGSLRVYRTVQAAVDATIERETRDRSDVREDG